MVALPVDVEDFIVWFHEGLVGSTWKVEGYVKEVYGFLILLPLIIIITAPPRVERSLNLFYSSSRSFYIYIYIYIYN